MTGKKVSDRRFQGVSLPPELLARVKVKADEDRRSMANYIAMVLEDHLYRLKAQGSEVAE